MYGLINKSLKSMVIDHHGQELWQQILSTSGVDLDSFVSMQRYDDQVTYALVGATSEVLKTPAEDCLEAFGVYWSTVVAPNAYGVLLDSTGTNLLEFLQHTNDLHDRITSTFIGYTPPHFEVSHEDNRVALHYESKRQGLTPFVIGVVKGLAQRFGSTIDIEPVQKVAVPEGESSIIYFTIN
ncbi:guanylyl cyclase [Pseudomaricurvus alcaniphilus]|uniref:heme NO-binding domain-containing protein n=1 Tax=Pseudomaricurvus alcaniphilus TaxID=1166482 RepID=UPI00140A2734|nr:heme NO-binding domain-containing protein [Pseudomaricurvus alcaniphilus]NHN37217.1 guanylyl cyclase [Pseudomaricurvus alcaniphilus]